MARIKLIGRLTKPGLRVAKVLFLGRAKKPSDFNRCVAAKLRGQKHPAAPEGAGGMRNKEWQRKFIEAVKECGAHLKESTREKWGV